jgi:hypothetical protein
MMSACTLEQVVSRFGRTHRYGLGAELREAVEELKVLCRLGQDVEALEASSPPPVAARQTVNDGTPQEAGREPSGSEVSLLPVPLVAKTRSWALPDLIDARACRRT